jgi:hypothetical protein
LMMRCLYRNGMTHYATDMLRLPERIEARQGDCRDQKADGGAAGLADCP